MKKFYDAFLKNKAVSFINLMNYLSKTSGEISDYLINVNLSVKNAKETDLKLLKACTDEDLKNISLSSNVPFETCKLALTEMLESATKNLSANLEDRTAQSQAQTDAYISLTPALRIHKETNELHIFGQAIRKTVKVKGTYKEVKSNPKTIAKNAIKKQLDLRSDKFRTFIVQNLDGFTFNGETLIFI